MINSIRLAAKVVYHEVNKAGLVDIIGAVGDTNIQGEDQQKLDVYANDKFIQTLINRNIVCGIASEEEDDFITINSQDENHQNKYVVLIDPLDGSSNIDVNVSVGTIFSVFRRVTPVGTPVKLEALCCWESYSNRDGEHDANGTALGAHIHTTHT